MQVQDQADTIAFLKSPSNHASDEPVQVIETHISVVFLTGDRAFKLKRAVHLPYADFSTPEIRLAACEKELRLDRAVTPELYLGVRRITREHDGLAFDGPGPLVDAVVEMQRFEQEDLLDRMAQRGALSARMVRSIADEIVSAHEQAEISDESGTNNIRGVLDINLAGFRESSVFSSDEIEWIDRAFRAALGSLSDLLDERSENGFVRRCHGDLHLRNLCLFGGRPRLFDCIDFNDQLATTDVLYDLAFLAMDLWHRDLKDHANLLVNRYFDRTSQEDGYACLPFFIALRAAVRAHVIATQAEMFAQEEATAKRREARTYYDLAMSLLQSQPPRLITIGGLSGSGKSTVAAALAAHVGAAPGARLIESDRIRKALFGVEAETRLPDEAYAPDVSNRVYAEMVRKAGTLLRSGASVVADAVFDRKERRDAISQAALSAGVDFIGIWLEVPADTLRKRVAERDPGASDATLDVLENQLAREINEIEWTHVSTSGSLKDTLAMIRDQME